MINIITGLFGLAGAWLEGKQKKQSAKDEREAELIRNNASWEEIQAANSKDSYKDEWWTLVLSIPLILVFIPGMDLYVLAGFETLAQLPEWYQYVLGIAIGASFGVKGIGSIIAKRKQ